MATTSLIISATDTLGKSVQKTVTDVNPNASNAVLAEFGEKVAALSTNRYGKTDRINKINCDTEGPTQTPTLDLITGSMATAAFTTSGTFTFFAQTITYTGDGEIYSDDKPDKVGVECIDVSGSKKLYVFWDTSDAPSLPFTFTVKARETDTYKAVSSTMTVKSGGSVDPPMPG